jgi:hypothetical protein
VQLAEEEIEGDLLVLGEDMFGVVLRDSILNFNVS